MITAGRVSVNGVVAALGQCAAPGHDSIMVDGVSISENVEFVYLMLNKPCGYLSTARDERGRKTVMELVSDVSGRVYPVGRLDLNSEGLLLFTNDGEFANRIMHPSFNKQKTYEVNAIGDVRRAVELMRLPVRVDDYTAQAVSVELLEEGSDGGLIGITITEGRNRQVRKMCAICGLKVVTLKRVSIGCLKLGSLKAGKWRYLTEEEVSSLG